MRIAHRSDQRLFRVALVVIGFTLVSCQGRSCNNNSTDPVAELIGPAGGTLRIPLPEGSVVVEVPPGALEKELWLTGVRRSEFLPGAASIAVDLGPEGTTFSKPVVIKFRPSAARSARLPAMVLRLATLVDDTWQFLPTQHTAPGFIGGATTHFSTFALVAPCMTAGTGSDFPLNGCPTFNPRVKTSVPLSLDVTAATISLRILVAASPGTGPATFSISGLTPRTVHYLHRDGKQGTDVLTADSTGRLDFVQDVSAPHLLMLSLRHGSVALSATTCVPPLGAFNSATNTCSLTQDVPDGDVSITLAGMILDCLDPVTQQRHTIGSAAAHVMAGVVVVDTPNVRVKNCDITNADFGVQVVRAGGFEGRSLNLSGGSSGSNGLGGRGVDAADSADVKLFDLDVVDFEYGVIGTGNGNLEVHHARVATGINLAFIQVPGGSTTQPLYTASLALVAVDGTLATFTDCTVDGLASGSVPLSLGAPVAIFNVATASVARLALDHVSAYAAGVWIFNGSNGVARISDSSVIDAQVGLRVEGDTSEVVGNTLANNQVGLQLTGTIHSVFHNNIHGNSMRQVESQDPLELSDTRPASPAYGQGNYWGRACPAALFVAGIDSNGANVTDSRPFRSAGAWASGNLPGCPTLAAPVLTSPVDGALLATGSPPFLGTAVVGATVELMEGSALRGSAQVGPIGAFYIAPVLPFPEGFHRVAVRARLNGSSSAVSATVGFTVESDAPGAPTISFPTAGLVVNGGSVVIAGAAEADALVLIKEGAATVGACVADRGGKFQATAELAHGAHSLTAIAQDPAGNSSPPSAAVSFSVVLASTATPLLGEEGKVRITSITETGDSFVPSAGESNTLQIEGAVFLPGNGGGKAGGGNSGVGSGYGRLSYRVDLWRQVTDPSTGREVFSFATTATVTTPPGGGNEGFFSIGTSWPGIEVPGGGFAPAGPYLGKLTLRVVRDPRAPVPPQPAPIPSADCAPGRGPADCVLDILEMLDSMSLLDLPLPNPGPTFPCGEPEVSLDGGTAEKVVGVRVFVEPRVTFGRFQVDSAAFQAGRVVNTNLDDAGTGLMAEQGIALEDGGTVSSTAWLDPEGDRVVSVSLSDCFPRDAGSPHGPVPCWNGTFKLPTPGHVRLTAGVSGTTVPRMKLSEVFTTPRSAGLPSVSLLGSRNVAVHGSLDRSGLRFFTRVPEIYNRIGLTTETEDFRPLYVDIPEIRGENDIVERPQAYRETPAYLNWDRAAPPLNSQYRWTVTDDDVRGQPKQFSYFADWKTDRLSARWVRDEPFSGCPDPAQLFASPRTLKFGGAGLGEATPTFPADAIFKTGTVLESDAGITVRVFHAGITTGDFRSVVDAGAPACPGCSGCCLPGGLCVAPSFTTQASCGINGQTCSACPAGHVCAAGVCL